MSGRGGRRRGSGHRQRSGQRRRSGRRLADDRRGRVPFALLGVLLLLGSAVVVTVQFEEGYVDRDARLAGDRAEAAAETALRDAVRDASERAAADPVVEPADTAAGDLLDEDRPFESYVELMVLLEVSDRFRTTEQSVGDASATVRLPAISRSGDGATRAEDDDLAAVERALNRTTVESTGTGLVEATVENVTVVVRSGETVVEERDRTLSVTVATPALTLHERTTDYEQRLNGGLTDSGSLDRSLTGGLYGLAWTRGWAQYLGLPVEDVLANRHVELLTNLGLIDAQRTAFGDADQQAEADLAAESVRVVANETTGFQAGGFADAALPEANADDPSPGEVASPPKRTTVVGVNETADRALADVVQPERRLLGNSHPAHERSLREIVVDALTVEGTVETASVRRSRTLVDRESPAAVDADGDPPADWVREGREADRFVTNVSTGLGPEPSVDPNWRTRTVETRRVNVTERVTITYTNATSGETRTVTEHYHEVHAVGVALATRPGGSEWIPEQSVADPDDGLQGELASAVEDELRERTGGVDEIAGDVVLDEWDGARVAVDPAGAGLTADGSASGPSRGAARANETVDVDALVDETYTDLAALRDEVRGVETEVETAMLATDADPAAELAATVEARRAGYVRAPTEYDGLEQRALVGARAAYVDRLLQRVEARSEVVGGTQDALTSKIDQIASLPRVGLNELLELGLNYARPEPAPVAADEPASDLRITVDGDPAYLERSEVNRTSVPPPTDENGSYYPLGTRTATVQTLPTDQIAQGVSDVAVDHLLGGEATVPLPAAARALAGAERVPLEDAGRALNATQREHWEQRARSGDLPGDAAVPGNGTIPGENAGTDAVTPSGETGNQSRRAQADTATERATQARADLTEEVESAVAVLEQTSVETVETETPLDRDASRRLVEGSLDRWPQPAQRALAFDNGSAVDAIAADLETERSVTDAQADRTATLLRAGVEEDLGSEATQVSHPEVNRAVDHAREAAAARVENATADGLDGLEDRVNERFDGPPVLGPKGIPVAPVPSWWVATANVWRVEVGGAYASFAARAHSGSPDGGAHVSYVRDGSSVGVDVTGDGRPERLGTARRIEFEAATTVVVVVPTGGGGVGNAEADGVRTSPGWPPRHTESASAQPTANRTYGPPG